MSLHHNSGTERVLSLQDNGYDALRLLLAAFVVYSHTYAVGGFGEEPLRRLSKEGVILGELGVLGFFGLSGFLVTASFQRSSSLRAFFMKRLRRIFPGFWVCLLATAFLFGPLLWLLNDRTLGEYPIRGADGALSYIRGNALLRITHHTIGTVLDQAAWQSSLNGSLWSLFPEFACYAGIAVLGFGGALSGSRWLLGIAALAAFTDHVLATVAGREAFPHIPSFYAFTNYSPFITAFCLGACACAWKDWIRFSWKTVVVMGGISLLTIKLGGFLIIAPLFVTAMVLAAGGLFRLRLKQDLSYGIYIYSFPCQQVLFATGIASKSVALFFAVSMVMAVACAWPSWLFVEKPSLHRG
ncbi:MAG: acyltransferase [Chthoniobacterales bacterium]|nr:acyltransferase [Chthoniobacterales bacterium]